MIIETIKTKEVATLDVGIANKIKDAFIEYAQQLNYLSDTYYKIIELSKDSINENLAKDAKKLRLTIRKIRTSANATRQEQKEIYLKVGQGIDSVFKVIKNTASDLESQLEEIERYEEREKQRKLNQLFEIRKGLLLPFLINDEEVSPLIMHMGHEEFTAYLKGKESLLKDHLQREKEIKKQAEAQKRELEQRRIEAERQRKELQIQKQEIEAQAKKLEQERMQKMQAELQIKKLQEDKKKEQERIEQQKIQEKERIKKEKYDAEQEEMQKDDKDRMRDLYVRLKALTHKGDGFESGYYKDLYMYIESNIYDLMNHIKDNVK